MSHEETPSLRRLYDLYNCRLLVLSYCVNIILYDDSSHNLMLLVEWCVYTKYEQLIYGSIMYPLLSSDICHKDCNKGPWSPTSQPSSSDDGLLGRLVD